MPNSIIQLAKINEQARKREIETSTLRDPNERERETLLPREGVIYSTPLSPSSASDSLCCAAASDVSEPDP